MYHCKPPFNLESLESLEGRQARPSIWGRLEWTSLIPSPASILNSLRLHIARAVHSGPSGAAKRPLAKFTPHTLLDSSPLRAVYLGPVKWKHSHTPLFHLPTPLSLPLRAVHLGPSEVKTLLVSPSQDWHHGWIPSGLAMVCLDGLNNGPSHGSLLVLASLSTRM